VSRLYAWAHAISPDEAVDAAACFPGLGLVLTGQNYDAALDLTVPPIAYVGNADQARHAAALAANGVRWHAAIVNDERNQAGPSGSYWTPEQYREVFATIAPILQAEGIPVSTMGLAPKRTWLWDTLRSRRFDDWYHARLPESDLRAFNPNMVRRRELERAMRKGEKWILSPAPFRGWWDNLLSPIKVREWARYARRPEVHAVALWCLREHQDGHGRWQTEHGLLDRHGKITRLGKRVLQALK
jgi:hypothetical protein